MKRVLLRVCVVLLVAGQLLRVSGGWLCGRTRPDHGAMAPGVPGFAASHAEDGTPCILGACVATTPAVVGPAVIGFIGGSEPGPLPAAPAPAHSLTRAPIPPPPRA